MPKSVKRAEETKEAVVTKVATKSFNIATLGDEKVEDLFTTTFQGVIDDYKNKVKIAEFETTIVRPVGKKTLDVEIKVFGMADVISRNEVHNKKTGKVVNALKKIFVDVPTKGQATFKFSDSVDLNTNDYTLYYKLA